MNIETDSEWNPYDIHEQEIESLRQQLAASQARDHQLRAHLEVIAGKRGCVDNCLGNVDIAELALAIPQNTTALQSMIAKAGEVMRERCWHALPFGQIKNCEAIRALPGVTLEDLKA